MRTFTKLRQMLASNEDLRRKIEAMEKKYDTQFKVVFDARGIASKLKLKPKTMKFKYLCKKEKWRRLEKGRREIDCN